MSKMKKLLSVLLLLVMLLQYIPVQAFAAEVEEEPVYEVISKQIVPETDLPDNDELFSYYADQVLYGYEWAPFGTAAGARLTGDEKLAYDALKPIIAQIAAGKRSSTAISLGDKSYNVNVGNGVIETWTPEVIVNFNEPLFDFDYNAVVHALLDDCPFELYWFDKTIGWYLEWLNTYDLCYVSFYFYVADAYSAGEYKTNTTKTKAASAAAANAKDVVAANAGKSDYQKMLAYRDYICNAVTYNYDALDSSTPYGDPWQLIYVFDGNSSTNVVCEGYSKAFQYLCDLGGLECISASGTCGGPHMWNVATLGGRNYLVDVTNCDNGTVGYPTKLFLVGAPYSNGGYTFSLPGYGNLTYYCDDLDLATSNYDPSAPAVTITTQPKSVTVAEGATATVSFKASGDGLTYTWYFKNKGASSFSKTTSFTSNTYSVTMDSSRDGRQVYCVVKDKYGNKVQTNTVTISMGKTAKITTQPKSVTVPSGSTATVSFKASGDGLTYIWYYKNKGDSSFTKTTSFTGNTYSVKMDSSRNGRQVYCVVKDKYGNKVKTDTVTLTMGNPAKITTQPKSVTVPSGSTATVSFKASGDGLTYIWYYKNKGDSSFTKTTSFTGNTYSVEMTSARNGRQIYCVVKDKYGNKVKTDTVTISMGNPAKITTQPKSVTAPSGATATVSFKASGDGLTYIWYYKNKGDSSFTKTTSFTGNTYSVEMTSARNGRQVYCVVKDKYGNKVKTDTVTLTMGNPARITTQPKSVTTPSGSTATVSFKASGDGLTYIWYYKNKGDSSFTKTTSFTGNTYSVKMDSSRNGRQVYCVVKDKYGNKVKTDTVTLTMGNPAKINAYPTSVTVAKGATATVSFVASGDGLTYTWYFKNKGASSFSKTTSFTGNTYSVKMDASRDGRQVYCVVKDKYGNVVTTNTVTLWMK